MRSLELENMCINPWWIIFPDTGNRIIMHSDLCIECVTENEFHYLNGHEEHSLFSIKVLELIFGASSVCGRAELLYLHIYILSTMNFLIHSLSAWDYLDKYYPHKHPQSLWLTPWRSAAHFKHCHDNEQSAVKQIIPAPNLQASLWKCVCMFVWMCEWICNDMATLNLCAWCHTAGWKHCFFLLVNSQHEIKTYRNLVNSL